MTPKPARSASPRLHPPKGNEGEGKEGPRTKSPSSPLLPFPPELPTGPGSPQQGGTGWHACSRCLI